MDTRIEFGVMGWMCELLLGMGGRIVFPCLSLLVIMIVNAYRRLFL